MSHYREPPTVLPSLRDFSAEVASLARDLDPIERAFLPSRSEATIDREYPALADALDAATRAHLTEQRALRAPCPAFVVGPPIGRVRPPATPIPDPGRMVSE